MASSPFWRPDDATAASPDPATTAPPANIALAAAPWPAHASMHTTSPPPSSLSAAAAASDAPALDHAAPQHPPPHAFHLPALHPPDMSTPGPLWLTSQNFVDWLHSASPVEDYLTALDKARFTSIHTFYRDHLDHSLDSYLDLDLDERPTLIRREDLRGDECDFQGIDWRLRRQTRAHVRARRTEYERDRLSPQLKSVRRNMVPTPNTESYFAFHKMDIMAEPYVPHFQLRNVVAATSHNDVFFARESIIARTDCSGAPPTVVADFSSKMNDGAPVRWTTLAAEDDVLIAGDLEGDYVLSGLATTHTTPYTCGRVPDRDRDAKSFITNHIHLARSRHTYTPQAILCSNDNRLRILDCHTNTFTHSFAYPLAVNCSATAPDARLRVVVGDFRDTLITNAETGQPLVTLNTHTDDVFACDWSDDGIHVATAAQDSSIVIWDSRNWSAPLKVMYSELSIPRSVKFSPLGSGPRVLVAAESDDVVDIVDAVGFEKKQCVDFWGTPAGTAFINGGEGLVVGIQDRLDSGLPGGLGGMLVLERCSWEGGAQREDSERRRGVDACDEDWHWDREEWRQDQRFGCGWHERDRRELQDVGSLVL